MRVAFFCRSRVAGNPQSGQEPPLFGAFGSPGGDPGARVAPAGGTFEQPLIARNNCARIYSRFHTRDSVLESLAGAKHVPA